MGTEANVERKEDVQLKESQHWRGKQTKIYAQNYVPKEVARRQPKSEDFQ